MYPNNFGQNNQYPYGTNPQQVNGGQYIGYGTNVNTNINQGFNDPNYNYGQFGNNQNTFNDPNYGQNTFNNPYDTTMNTNFGNNNFGQQNTTTFNGFTIHD